jgi:hypothetical protein
VCGGHLDRFGELGGVGADAGRVEVAGAVEPDQGVEVDDAAALELRDLDEGDTAPPAPPTST